MDCGRRFPIFILSLVAVLLLCETKAYAVLEFQVEGTYLSDLVSGAKQPSYASTFGVSKILFTIDSERRLGFGFAYIGYSTPWMNNGTTDTLNGYDLGPTLKFDFCHKGLCSLSASYGMLVKAAYLTPTLTDSWTGQSYLYEFSLQPEISDHWRTSISVAYYYDFFTSQTVSNTTSGISVQHTATYTLLGLVYEW